MQGACQRAFSFASMGWHPDCSSKGRTNKQALGVVVLPTKNAILAFGLFTFCTIGTAVAQTPPTAEIRGQGQIQGQEQAQAQQPTPGQGPAQTTEAPPVKETWKAPFSGTFTATFAAATDYSYRGISQTQRQVAVQPSF